MLQDEDWLRRAGASDEDIEVVRGRHRGGVSGSRGGEYERAYALHRMIAMLAQGVETLQDGAAVLIQAVAPVDDVVVVDLPRFDFCQARLSASTRWIGTAAIAPAFEMQLRFCDASPDIHDFRLIVVTPHPDVAALLEQSMPTHLNLHTVVEHFPEPRTLPEMAGVTGLSRTNADDLCVVRLESHRSDLVKLLAGSLGAVAPGTHWVVLEVVEWLESLQSTAPFRLRAIELDPPVEATLDRLEEIDDLEVLVEGGICYYRRQDAAHIVLEEGIIGRVGRESFNRFVRRIMESMPVTFEEFELHLT